MHAVERQVRGRFNSGAQIGCAFFLGLAIQVVQWFRGLGKKRQRLGQTRILNGIVELLPLYDLFFVSRSDTWLRGKAAAQYNRSASEGPARPAAGPILRLVADFVVERGLWRRST